MNIKKILVGLFLVSMLGACKEKEPEIITYNIEDYYNGYYKDIVSWTNGEDLKQQLYNVISNYTPLPYTTPNWETNQYADQDLYDHDYVDVLYNKENKLKVDTTKEWQREHCFAASLMCGKTTSNATKTLGRATDFHNIYAGDASANSSRSNKNFGNADSTRVAYQDRTVDNGYDGYKFDDLNFEPGNKDKGKVARACMYMATMYKDNEYEEDGTTIKYKGLQLRKAYVAYQEGAGCDYAIGNLNTLLNWNNTYSVDLSEYQHNESVYSHVFKINSETSAAQGNRNPYVDFPELGDYVFGSKANEAGEMKDLKPSCIDLNIAKEGVRYYAIKDAFREVEVNQTFTKDLLNVVAVNYDMSESEYNDYTLNGISIGENMNTACTKKVSVVTPINTIDYDLKVYTDPVLTATYSHKLTGKSKSGDDFYEHKDKTGVDCDINMAGVTWTWNWTGGKIGSLYADKGLAFGSGTTPISKVTATSKTAFNNIKNIYLVGTTAKSGSFTVTMKVGGVPVKTGAQISYNENGLTTVTYTTPSTITRSGTVTFEITNTGNKTVYIQYIAVNY